nr:lysosomal-associated transmembrane protein 5 [Loxodonta africana]
MAPRTAAVRQTCCCFNVRIATTALAIYHVIMSVLLLIEHSVEVAHGKASCKFSKTGYLRIGRSRGGQWGCVGEKGGKAEVGQGESPGLGHTGHSFRLCHFLVGWRVDAWGGGPLEVCKGHPNRARPAFQNREKYLLPFLSLQVMDFLLCLLTLLGSYIELPAYLKFASRSRTGPSKVPLMTLQLLDFCLSIMTLCSSYMEVPTYLNFKSMNHMNYLPSQEGMAHNQFIKMMIIFSIAFITVLILKVYMFKCVWRCYKFVKYMNSAEKRNSSKMLQKVVLPSYEEALSLPPKAPEGDPAPPPYSEV